MAPLTNTDNASDKVILLVDGIRHSGWQSVSINRSLETVAGTFSLTLTERWPGQDTARPVMPGRPCQVLIDSDKIMTGYVDDANPQYDKSSHAVQVTGRCKTGDLVDCSAIYKSGQWRNVKLETITQNLLAPFGIGVTVEANTGKAFPSHNIEEGESVFECIERAARQRAVLLVSDADGNLVITTASKTQTGIHLEEGKTIESASAVLSWKDRFNRITVKGQAKPSDGDFGEGATRGRGVATDEEIDRYRPLILIAEDAGNGATLSQRAVWERNTRRGKGRRVTITVSDWRVNGPNSPLWQPNMLVSVTSPRLYMDNAPLLVTGCQYQLSDAGTTTVLSLAPREAFVQIAAAPANRKKRGGDNDWGGLS